MLEHTFYTLAIFLIMLIPLQFGFAFFSSVQIGPYLHYYVTMLGSMQQ